MSYRCLICNVVVDSPSKLEVHLQVVHKWGKKRETLKDWMPGFDNYQ